MSDIKLRHARILFLLGAASFLLAACGGNKKTESSPETESAEDASAEAEDAATAAPPEWMSEHKDDIIFWARTAELDEIYHDMNNVFQENGHSFMFVKGNCEYWVYTSFDGEGNNIQQKWSDIYTGILSNEDCTLFQNDLSLGQNNYSCVFYNCQYYDVFDGCGSFLMADADGALRCGCDCSMDEVKKTYSNQQKWFEYMLKNGRPADGKLRGMLVFARDEYSAVWADMPDGLEKNAATRDLWENIPYFFPENVPDAWLPSPEWKPDTSTPAIRGMTIIFPDEYQEQLKELRQRMRNLEFGTGRTGIPLVGKDGNKYALFLRPSIPLEDEHGLIDPPERCEQWDVVESMMEYPQN